jgi:hypothetical protein
MTSAANATAHVVGIEPVPAPRTQPGGSLNEPPRFVGRCTCGWRGNERVALNPSKVKVNLAKDEARTDAVRHQTEALELEQRNAGAACIGVSPDRCQVPYCPVHGDGVYP